MRQDPARAPHRLTAAVLGAAIVVIGIVAFVGSRAGSAGASAWGADRPPMVPLTAIGVMGLGAAVIAAAVGARRCVTATLGVTVAAVLVGLGQARNWWAVPGWLEADPASIVVGADSAPASSSTVLLGVAAVALALQNLRRTIASQVLMAVLVVLVYASIAAHLLGDRSYIIDHSSLPQTHTSLPAAAAIVLVALGSVLSEPDRGIAAWLGTAGPGRTAFRRIVLPLALSPLAAVALVRGLRLEARVGAPRADAVIVTLMALLLLVAAVEAVREIDRLAIEANQRQVADTLAAAHSVAARRAERVASLAGRLSGASSVQRIVDVLVTDGPATLDAALLSVALPDADRSSLWVTRSIPGGTTEPRLEALGAAAPTPIVDAFRSAMAVWITSEEELASRYPDVAVLARSAGIASFVAMPLLGASARPIGALTVGWSAEVQPDDALRSVVATVGELCSQSIQRALLTDSEHRLIAGLQERLVGQPPTLRLLDLDVRYRPAADLGMGGDWYEVIEAEDGQVTVVLGDVSGHGVEAVADMARARTLIGSLVRQGRELGDILHQVDDLLGRDDPVMATVVLVHVDPTAGVLRHTCAGHPPIAFRFADGSVSFSEGSRQPLLGAGLSLGPLDAVEVAFPPGSVAVVYSDGLIERRGEDLNRGLDRLARTLGSAPRGPAEEIAEYLVREMLAASDELDDTALVVIRRGLSLPSGTPAAARTGSGGTELVELVGVEPDDPLDGLRR